MSFTFNQEAIEKIAHLARLSAENTRDQDNLQEQLNNIVQMVSQITNAQTEGIAPMDPLDLSAPVREDRVTEPNDRDRLQKLAAKTDAGLYLVPTVIE